MDEKEYYSYTLNKDWLIKYMDCLEELQDTAHNLGEEMIINRWIDQFLETPLDEEDGTTFNDLPEVLEKFANNEEDIENNA